MKTILEMKQERARLIGEARKLNDLANTENRDFTEEEQGKYDGYLADVEVLKKKIERAEQLEAEERDLGTIDGGDGFQTDPTDNGDETRSGFKVGDKREEKKPWSRPGEFLRCVASAANGHLDERLAASMREERAATGMSEGVLSDGGFLVPPEFASELLHDALETGILGQRCRQQTMSKTSLTIPGVDETSRANGSRWGGIQTYWENEADEMTSSKPKFRQINLKAKKLTGLVYMTDELLEDAPAIESFVGEGFRNEFGFKIDDVIVRGSGSGEPLGFTNAGCYIEQAKETGQTAATILADNVMKMFKRMLPRSLGNAVWYINQECWAQIFSLHLSVGTGGVPLYLEPGKIKDAPYGAIFGRPIQPIEQCEALGTSGDIIFADLGAYILASKNGLQTASSIHVKFLTSQTAFRFILRMDGEPLRASALTPYKGSDTLSSFIALATRS
jgi:HK97 family phage major capsid protein